MGPVGPWGPWGRKYFLGPLGPVGTVGKNFVQMPMWAWALGLGPLELAPLGEESAPRPEAWDGQA